MAKRKTNLSRLRCLWVENKGDILGIGAIFGFFGLLFLAAATGGVAMCVQSVGLEIHPTGPLGKAGLVFFFVAFISTFFLYATAFVKVTRLVHAAPYVMCFIGAAFIFVAQAPNIFDPLVGTLICLALTAINHGLVLYEMRKDGPRLQKS